MGFQYSGQVPKEVTVIRSMAPINLIVYYPKNKEGKTVSQLVFNTQAIGGGFSGNGGDGWLRILEFMPDKKTVKATTFSPLFAISPSTRHLAWKTDERNSFTFILE